MSKLVILGAGKSGAGAAQLAKQQGLEIFVSDSGKISEATRQLLDEMKIPWEQEGHSIKKVLAAEEIVKSPGIPDTAEIVVAAKAREIPLISEIEFASRYTDAQVVAVTGSNGKSTTASLCYHIMKKAGLDVVLAGNIGESFAASVATQKHAYYVLELSSFQLDGIRDFKPHVAVLLNITPDHLDRYNNSMDEYAASKFRISMNQTADDYFLYCSDDPKTSEQLPRHTINAILLPFSEDQQESDGAWVDGEQIIVEIKKKRFDMYIYDLALQGKHNLYNSMASAIVANIFDLRKDIVRESLKSFTSLEHRLEFVVKVAGIDFINDSKATNVNSAWYALETMTQPTVWIAGGADKGNDYETLKPIVAEKVKVIVCMGLDNRKIHEAFQNHVDVIVNTGGAEEAVKMAYHLANKGDAVLLSPACASFDLFENFEDRGRQFKDAARSL